MRTRIMILTALGATILATTPGLARTPCVGISGGRMLLRDGADNDLREGVYSLGLRAGWEDVAVYRETGLGAELEVCLPVASGKTFDAGTWNVTTAAFYSVARIGRDDIYLKGRLGLLYEHVSIDAGLKESANDFGLSCGAGLGLRLGGDTSLESELVLVGEKMAYLSLGVMRGF